MQTFGKEHGAGRSAGLDGLLLVVRPLVRRVITPDESVPAMQAALPATAHGGDTTAQIPHSAAAPALAPPGAELPMPAVSNKTSKMIDIAQVKGQVHAQSVQKVGELADQNPNDAVAIIRSWMNDAA